ncbi:hypothetical protein [Streptomyces sp. NPDC046909]|uniref:nuclear transport factor 2 family protein n=1 Tax=Streptomyces sp. NPDC046909 TaxID=3155617 RepID=UPI0033E3C467
MSDSPNLALGFPYGGVYKTWAGAGGDSFGRLAPRFTSFGAVAEEFYDADGDHVFVRGHCHAVSKSGAESDARFIHLWTVSGGKLTHLVQAADSHVVQLAANN